MQNTTHLAGEAAPRRAGHSVQDHPASPKAPRVFALGLKFCEARFCRANGEDTLTQM